MRSLLLMLLAIVSVAVGFAQTNTIQLRNGANTTTLIAPSGGNYTLTLPGAGTNGQVLSTNGSGTLSWTTIIAGATNIDGLSDAKSGGTNFTGSLMLGQEPASLGVNALQNTAVGIGALSSLTTGDNNVAVGYNALGSGSTSIETVAIGYNALSAGSGAGRVVAIGPEAASSCATCNYSVFIGRRAGAATNVVSDNTVVGNDAFRMNTSGSDNTVVGANAMENQTAGNFNTAVGRWAGVSNTTGSGSVFLGYNAGPTAAGAVNNSLYIHNASSNTPLIKGDFAATTLTFNGSITTTGTSALNGNVTVGGGASVSELRMLEASGDGSNYTAFKAQAQAANVTYTLPAADGTSGQTLITNGSGSLSWGAAGATTLDGLSDAKVEGTDFTGSMILGHQATGTLSAATYNTAVGIGAMDEITQGDYNTALGSSALTKVTTGNYNIAVGSDALVKVNTGSYNVSLGSSAGREITIGTYNVSVGHQAGNGITTGVDNIAIGFGAFYFTTTGSNNVGVGRYTMNAGPSGSNNVAVGSDALRMATAVERNVAIGAYAGRSVTIGDFNTLLGYRAGDSLTTGSSNVFIGYQVGTDGTIDTESDLLMIDNSSTLTPLIYGNFSTDALTFNGSTTTTGNVTVGGGASSSEVRFLEPSGSGSNYSAFKAQAQAANVTYTLPAADGTSGYYMSTNGSGTLSWAANSLDNLSDAKNGGTGFSNSLILGHQTTGVLSLNAEENTAVGINALKSITTGDGNTALGMGALESVTSNERNTAIGAWSMNAGTGTWNTYVGAFTGGPFSTGNVGDYNVGVGNDVLNSVTTGSNNVIIGMAAGYYLTTGTGNIFIGYHAGDAVAIDTESDKLIIENSDNVLTPLIYGDFAANTLTINGAVTCVSLTQTSDARLKRNIQPLVNAMDVVQQLRPVSYDKRESLQSNDYNMRQMGFIAQELEKVLPNSVSTDKSADAVKSVDYLSLIPVLTKALQEQQTLIANQQQRLDKQQAEIDELRQLIKRMSVR